MDDCTEFKVNVAIVLIRGLKIHTETVAAPHYQHPQLPHIVLALKLILPASTFSSVSSLTGVDRTRATLTNDFSRAMLLEYAVAN